MASLSGESSDLVPAHGPPGLEESTLDASSSAPLAESETPPDSVSRNGAPGAAEMQIAPVDGVVAVVAAPKKRRRTI